MGGRQQISFIDLVQQVPSRIALALARRRFPNLCAPGILGRAVTAPAVDLDEIAVAMSILWRCRRTKCLGVHTSDLAQTISHLTGHDVSVGAIIAAAMALRFRVTTFRVPRAFYPNAMIGVHRADIRKLMRGARR